MTICNSLKNKDEKNLKIKKKICKQWNEFVNETKQWGNF